MTRSEKAWMWVVRVLGGSSLVYVLIVLKGEIPTPGWVVIGGLLGAEHVYKAQKRVNEEGT